MSPIEILLDLYWNSVLFYRISISPIEILIVIERRCSLVFRKGGRYSAAVGTQHAEEGGACTLDLPRAWRQAEDHGEGASNRVLRAGHPIREQAPTLLQHDVSAGGAEGAQGGAEVGGGRAEDAW